MSSIFDLKQSAAELPSLNQGTAKLTYQQVPPTRSVTGNNFPNGSIHIRWETSGTRWWIPSRSYIRMRARLTSRTAAGVEQAIQFNDDIAPNMGLMANLFQSAEFRIADKTVSRVSDYMSQIDALEKRLGKSKAWLDAVGADLEWWEHSQAVRSQKISSGLPPVGGESPENECWFPDQVGLAGMDDLAQGYDRVGGNTITVTAVAPGDVGTLTFLPAGGAQIPEGRTLYKNGDTIRYLGFNYMVTNVRLSTGGPPLTSQVVDVKATKTIVTVGASAANPWFLIRKSDQIYCPARDGFEMIWQPPLSIFKVAHAMPKISGWASGV